MGVNFADGKRALGLCDICGQQYKLKTLKPVFRKHNNTGLLACRTCWDPDHPQLMLGELPVYDPQALRNPRPDTNERGDSRQLYDQFGNPVDEPVDPGEIL